MNFSATGSDPSGSVVWITGARGLIGNALVQSANALVPHYRVRGLTRAEVDLLDFAAVTALFSREKPDLVIHCAALSKSGDCEGNPQLAWRNNVDVTRHLAELASSIPIIFFSTDLIFDGKTGNYVEDDCPNPLSIYGETKARAEELVRRHPRHAIVRISLTGGRSPARNRGFNEEMKNAWREGRTLNLFTDEYRCPGVAEIVARAVWEIAAKELRGTYHLCGAERLSRYEIGCLLAERHPELNPKIKAGSRADYKGPPRPKDTSMNCEKLRRFLSFQLPAFSEWLARDTSGF